MKVIIERRRIHCPIKHVGAFVSKYDDGSFNVKCSNRQACGNTCPYLKDPHYKSTYRRSPEYRPE